MSPPELCSLIYVGDAIVSLVYLPPSWALWGLLCPVQDIIRWHWLCQSLLRLSAHCGELPLVHIHFFLFVKVPDKWPAWLSVEWVSCIFTPHTDTFCQLGKCRVPRCTFGCTGCLCIILHTLKLTAGKIPAADFSEEVWLGSGLGTFKSRGGFQTSKQTPLLVAVSGQGGKKADELV